MRNRLECGATVETVQPEKESTDWDPEALKARRWGASGKIVKQSDSHGLCYLVEHEDGTKAWYEPRELKYYVPGQDYSPEERVVMLQKMEQLRDLFYGRACAAGCHAFIEFAGLMGEFIKVCADAHRKGDGFPFANTHSGTVLPFQPYHLAYLAEKLNCIYGPAMLSSETNRSAFITSLFDGQYKLEPVVVPQQQLTSDEDQYDELLT